jgi:hypothetical protein
MPMRAIVSVADRQEQCRKPRAGVIRSESHRLLGPPYQRISAGSAGWAATSLAARLPEPSGIDGWVRGDDLLRMLLNVQ